MDISAVSALSFQFTPPAVLTISVSMTSYSLDKDVINMGCDPLDPKCFCPNPNWPHELADCINLHQHFIPIEFGNILKSICGGKQLFYDFWKYVDQDSRPHAPLHQEQEKEDIKDDITVVGLAIGMTLSLLVATLAISALLMYRHRFKKDIEHETIPVELDVFHELDDSSTRLSELWTSSNIAEIGEGINIVELPHLEDVSPLESPFVERRVGMI
ncbi:hypothetical protein BS50DRAFT_584634 [Corynespora cassiicola Philippines]|uniref:Extracellular membrane protein CFEM domain-containing protein n=1 Tax=Corynespora cassiicola Philippines TaxID=1448308 RepID=A0A2T2P090_CORCC|nr:hypothetical protein BS50DRAFT_584634 [Corynespora cassiicola Philippines]